MSQSGHQISRLSILPKRVAKRGKLARKALQKKQWSGRTYVPSNRVGKAVPIAWEDASGNGPKPKGKFGCFTLG